MNILVTGSAGFIGMHLCKRLLADGHIVHGVDNFNDYYSVRLKRARQAQLASHAHYSSDEVDISDLEALNAVFRRLQPRGTARRSLLDRPSACLCSVEPVRISQHS